jgi:peptidoglycan hydrolase-like protein with peptidoglycan-binding domain
MTTTAREVIADSGRTIASGDDMTTYASIEAPPNRAVNKRQAENGMPARVGLTPTSNSSIKPDNTSAVLIDFAKPNEVKRAQQRLIELGYLDDAADGKWGPRSRRSLQEFRTAMGLGAGDSWDQQTQQQLFSRSAERSVAISPIVSSNPAAAGQQPGACWIPTNDDSGVGYWGACSDKGSRPFK